MIVLCSARPGKNVYFPKSWAKFPSPQQGRFPSSVGWFPYVHIMYFFIFPSKSQNFLARNFLFCLFFFPRPACSQIAMHYVIEIDRIQVYLSIWKIISAHLKLFFIWPTNIMKFRTPRYHNWNVQGKHEGALTWDPHLFLFKLQLSSQFTQMVATSEIRQESRNPFSQRFLSTKLQGSKWILVNITLYHAYKVIWWESMDFSKIPLGESKWILTLGYKSDPTNSTDNHWLILMFTSFESG